jgi:NADH dehydrogenase
MDCKRRVSLSKLCDHPRTRLSNPGHHRHSERLDCDSGSGLARQVHLWSIANGVTLAPVPVSRFMKQNVPVVVIVGGGFAGLSAARAMRNTPAQVVLIDRTNHHVFQPLLYQVATSVLSPAQIASPIRQILHKHRNTAVVMAEVVGVDKERKLVYANSPDRAGVPLPYDYLVLATGATHSYFGHDEFQKHAPGLKTLADAVAIRNKILEAFEQAEAEEDTRAHRDLLTFVLVGGGPAGVEMAGAIAFLVRNSLRTQFRRIDPTSARIILVDRSQKVLGPYSDELSAGAKQRLENLGVEVRLGQGVDLIDADGVVVAGERIPSKTVIWTAGVAPSPAGKWLGVETDRAGRVRVQQDLTIPGHPEIFVVGDTSSLEQDGKPLGGVAQVALQGGRHAGLTIHHRITGKHAPGPFRYFDKGTMAVVGQGYAVLESGKIRVKGLVAWLAWAVVHILSLAQPGLRISVFLQWSWTYLTRQRGSRLIVNHRGTAQEWQAPAGAVMSLEAEGGSRR